MDKHDQKPRTELATLATLEPCALEGVSSKAIMDYVPPFSHEIFLVESYVQGMYANPDRDRLLDSLCIGDELTLVCEPENSIRNDAIRVIDGKGEQLGYVCMDIDYFIARLMSVGKTLFARVSQVDNPADNHEVFNCEHAVRFDIFMRD